MVLRTVSLLLILGYALGALALSTGVGLYIYNQRKRMLASVAPPVVEAKPAPSPELNPPPYKIAFEVKNATISLVNRKRTQIAYAQFTLWLDLEDEEAKQRMALEYPKLLDAILEASAGMQIEEFRSPEGFRKLHARLDKTFKERFGKHAPRGLAIRDWLIN